MVAQYASSARLLAILLLSILLGQIRGTDASQGVLTVPLNLKAIVYDPFT